MSEVPTTLEPETPASSEEIRIRGEARRVGEEAANSVRNHLAGLEIRTGSMVWWPTDAARKAEAEVLRQHGLIDDVELEKRSTPPERQGVGRGLVITV